MTSSIKNSKLDNFQLVAFCPGIQIADKLKAASEINNAARGLFDGDPTIFPIPGEAPPEVPRIILKSKDNLRLFQVAGNRIDFIYKLSDAERESEVLKVGKELFQIFSSICAAILEQNGTKFTRTALVTNWAIFLEEESPNYLVKTYTKEPAIFNSPAAFELHNLNKSAFSKCKVNQWLRIKSAQTPQGTPNVLNVIVDINSLAEEAYEVNTDFLSSFLSEAINETSKIIKSHFGTILK